MYTYILKLLQIINIFDLPNKYLTGYNAIIMHYALTVSLIFSDRLDWEIMSLSPFCRTPTPPPRALHQLTNELFIITMCTYNAFIVDFNRLVNNKLHKPRVFPYYRQFYLFRKNIIFFITTSNNITSNVRSYKSVLELDLFEILYVFKTGMLYFVFKN